MTVEGVLRLDKWLWYARFFKTRAQATKMINAGKLRLDGQTMSKPHRAAIIGMTLTFPQATEIRVIKIAALGTRRGPAPEAQLLYEDLAPPVERKRENNFLEERFEARDSGAGRPTKRERRETTRLKDPFA